MKVIDNILEKEKDLCSRSEQANLALDELCRPERLFTDEERESFFKEYAQIASDYDEWNFAQRLLSRLYFYEIGKFITNYRKLPQLQEDNNRLYQEHRVLKEIIPAQMARGKQLLDVTHYLSHSVWEQFVESNRESEYVAKKYEQYEYLQLLHTSAKEIRAINDSFLEKALRTHREYFDTLFRYPLDEQQRRAVLNGEDNTLVISAAGSGKTSTIIGKTRYLVEKEEVNPNRILLISYTRKAAGELRDRLQYEGITCSTFHALAIDIIAQAEGRKPTICKPELMQQIFYDKLKDLTFKAAVVQYILLFRNAPKDEHDYNTPAEKFADRRKYGVQAPFKDMNGHIIYTKSEQEMMICTVLSILGVKFLYEEPYEYEMSDIEHHQYKPDFSIYYTDADGKKQRVYLEHFAIDKNGNVPKYFGQEDSERYNQVAWKNANIKYNQDIVWKRRVHEVKKTRMIETTSAEFYAGDPRVIVRHKLQKAGIPLHPLKMDQVYEELVQRDKYLEKNVLDLISAFITLMKANDEKIEHVLEQHPSPRTSFILQHMIEPVYRAYEKYLTLHHEIDFTDAILKATEICNNPDFQRNYDYILVDEFQDISVDRYKFLLALRKGDVPAKLFCVGDDWQSIYRFSGSDLNLFSQYEEYFGVTERCQIEHTHRFGQPLVKESSMFIKKNPVQVQKNVQPMDGVETALTYYPYDANQENGEYELLRSILRTIPKDESVYILGRYTYDAETLNVANNVTYDEKRGKITVLIDGRELRFMTVHSSKGLEADHVLLINCNEGQFPSIIADDPVLTYVLSKEDEYPDSEERRVYYVGITRARKHTYVLYDGQNPSPFVSEFVGVATSGRHICPKCRNGYIQVIKNGQAKNGNYYQRIRCSNQRSGCDYFRTIFQNEREFGMYGSTAVKK